MCPQQNVHTFLEFLKLCEEAQLRYETGAEVWEEAEVGMGWEDSEESGNKRRRGQVR